MHGDCFKDKLFEIVLHDIEQADVIAGVKKLNLSRETKKGHFCNSLAYLPKNSPALKQDRRQNGNLYPYMSAKCLSAFIVKGQEEEEKLCSLFLYM